VQHPALRPTFGAQQCNARRCTAAAGNPKRQFSVVVLPAHGSLTVTDANIETLMIARTTDSAT
jgi:hypothetical protein